jgi:hypothetical protein
MLMAVSAFSRSTADPVKWIEDLKKFRTQLPKVHKNLFFKINQHEFDSLVYSLEKNVAHLSETEIFFKLKQITAKIGDTHTSVYYEHNPVVLKYLPVRFEWFTDSLRIIRSTGAYKDLLGCKLLSINNVSMSSLTDSLKTMFVNENEATVKYSVPRMLDDNSYLSYLKILNSDTIALKLLTPDGKKLNREILLLTERKSFSENLIGREKPYYLMHLDKAFWSTYIKTDSVLYVQYNKCISKETFHNVVRLSKKNFKIAIRKKMPSFSRFSAGVIDQIEKTHPKKVIIDLRFNSGGSSLQGTQFAGKLAKYKDIRFFVVTGRKTFSSAIINALDFKTKTGATIIGESTAGKPNHYGEVKSFTLPNSGVKIQYSTKFFKLIKNDMQTIEPDIVKELSFEDYMSGIDPVYEYIRSN